MTHSSYHPHRPRSEPRNRRLAVGPRGVTTALAIALALAVFLEPAGAQDRELRVVPSAGVMVPTSILYRSDLPESTAELGNAPLLSAGVHFFSRSFPFSLRLTLDRAGWFDTDVLGHSDGQEHPFTVPTSITLVTGDLLFHPYRWDRLAPYTFLGLGRKNYTFGNENPPGSHLPFTFPEDVSGVRLHYGVGVELEALGRTLGVEAGGNFNRYVLVDEFQGISRSQDQHEFVLRALLPIPLLRF